MKYKAMCDNIGFMGRYWTEGDITPDIDEAAAEESAAVLKAHFQLIAAQSGIDIPPGATSDEIPPAQYMSEITGQRADLSKKTVAELKLIAAQSGIDIPPGATKAEILELLK